MSAVWHAGHVFCFDKAGTSALLRRRRQHLLRGTADIAWTKRARSGQGSAIYMHICYTHVYICIYIYISCIHMIYIERDVHNITCTISFEHLLCVNLSHVLCVDFRMSCV